MPDKNLTDNEIIKALNTALGMEHISIYCANIKNEVQTIRVLDIIDLINRQKARIQQLELKVEARNKVLQSKIAELERLDKEVDRLSQVVLYNNGVTEMKVDEAKTKAYKECIEKVKEEIAEALESNYKARAERIEKHNVGETDEFISYLQGKIDCLRGLDDFLDNLLKELEGEANEDTCVCCGAVVPEGRQVCVNCEKEKQQ